ncbi:MAG TPA: polysulfide reductase NrfD [Kiritimatiellia bacterium]|nr:polysulfide reductase NrfD [Kiritimatiellia bacterium]HMO97798.1 polysulfide reductase NrfD [Kiritimatiellia bacterium]HMP96390.1 polysulfide reductase NrfD [Kiritimatiellia bacterium]
MESVTDKISKIPLTPTLPRPILAVGMLALLLLGGLLPSVVILLVEGTGVWGINQPVGWGFAIINFVWWIGIGHAGTLISAILLLLRQEWRTSINRFAETMTIFAVTCAGLFPALHIGRPWLAYWLFPYPNVMEMWPQFRSPLIWDVVAVSTYATVSILFWFTGLIPDLATLRDRAKNKFVKIGYGIASMGWRGSARHWQRYEIAYLLLAGLSTPLVVSVHSIVGLDFAVSVIPGWHVTIFPPYFVAGAIFSGFAMVLTLSIPLRALFGWKDMITLNHLNNISKVMLATCLMVLYGYGMEIFFAWYSASEYEGYMKFNRMYGPYWWSYWSLILCNGVIPQLLWFKKVRTSPVILFFLSIVINIGMWLERFVIVITSLHRDFLPSSWGMYYPTKYDWGLYLGTIGLFLFLMVGAIKVLPMISQFEVRELLHKKQRKH